MKKTLLFFAVAITAIITSCDPTNYYYLELKNGMDSEMIVEVEGKEEAITIQPGTKRVIHALSSYGYAGDYYDAEHNFSYLEIHIDNVQLPISVWRRKYWEYENKDIYHASYILTITDEFIKSLLTE